MTRITLKKIIYLILISLCFKLNFAYGQDEFGEYSSSNDFSSFEDDDEEEDEIDEYEDEEYADSDDESVYEGEGYASDESYDDEDEMRDESKISSDYSAGNESNNYPVSPMKAKSKNELNPIMPKESFDSVNLDSSDDSDFY